MSPCRFPGTMTIKFAVLTRNIVKPTQHVCGLIYLTYLLCLVYEYTCRAYILPQNEGKTTDVWIVSREPYTSKHGFLHGNVTNGKEIEGITSTTV